MDSDHPLRYLEAKQSVIEIVFRASSITPESLNAKYVGSKDRNDVIPLSDVVEDLIKSKILSKTQNYISLSEDGEIFLKNGGFQERIDSIKDSKKVLQLTKLSHTTTTELFTDAKESKRWIIFTAIATLAILIITADEFYCKHKNDTTLQEQNNFHPKTKCCAFP